MKNIEDGLSWVYSQRNEMVQQGIDPASIDMLTVETCRKGGEQESIPLVALEHSRLHALFCTFSVEKTQQQAISMAEQINAAGRKLLSAGWEPIQLTANAMNVTIDFARERIRRGFVSHLHGVPDPLSMK